ncbi:MAG: DUF4153 domain-containing protein [Saprospiraceae bacterium]
MRLPTPGFLLTAFFQVCRRFPGTMLCTAFGTVACFALIDYNSVGDIEEFFVRNWMVSQLGLPFLTALVAYSESKGWSETRSWLLQVLGIAALVGCWFWLDTKAEHFERLTLPRYFVLFLVAHLAVAVAPYLNARPVRDFWEYNRQLFANIVVGSVFTFILYVGLALAVLAVDNLFNTHIQERVYAKLFVLLAGVFNTAYFLFHFPKKYAREEADSSGAYNWVFRNLCKYILIPIVILYFLILYAYGAKIGAQWSLPKGWVSSLVIGFSVAGIFTYLLNFYLAEEDDSAIVKGFKRWFWWVLLPPTGLLFVAIGKRIGDYGITEERYLVLLLGLWLAAACLYFLFSKNDNIKFIPISLALLAPFVVFGPLSAFSVSERSQKGILTNILERNGRFENGKMKPGTAPLTDPEREQVGSAINYLERRNALSDLMPTPIDSAWLEYGGLLDWLKIETALSEKVTNRLTIGATSSYEPFEVRGFDMAYKADLRPTSDEERSQGVSSDIPFCLSENGTMLEWRQEIEGKSTLIEAYSLAPAIQTWWDKQEKVEEYGNLTLPVSARTLSLPGRRASLRFVVEDAHIEMEGDEKRLTYCNGWVLLKEK